MLFGSTSRRFDTISIFPSIPIATYLIKVVQEANAGESTCRKSSTSGHRLNGASTGAGLLMVEQNDDRRI
jgi:hypothetical protein